MWNDPTLIIFEVIKGLCTLTTHITLADSDNFWITGIYGPVDIKKYPSSNGNYRTGLAYAQRIGFWVVTLISLGGRMKS